MENRFEQIVQQIDESFTKLKKAVKHIDNAKILSEKVLEVSEITNEHFKGCVVNIESLIKKDFKEKISALEKQIGRLLTDFEVLFQKLQEGLIHATKEVFTEIANEIKSKTEDLQNKVVRLKDQIDRLEKINFEERLDMLEAILSDLSVKINDINIALLTVKQDLFGVIRRLGLIQSTADLHFKEITSQIGGIEREMSARFDKQDRIIELCFSKLQRSMKINRIIYICWNVALLMALLLAILMILRKIY
jgi:uncharacterized phage infection (PIP) family protein YhgE